MSDNDAWISCPGCGSMSCNCGLPAVSAAPAREIVTMKCSIHAAAMNPADCPECADAFDDASADPAGARREDPDVRFLREMTEWIMPDGSLMVSDAQERRILSIADRLAALPVAAPAADGHCVAGCVARGERDPDCPVHGMVPPGDDKVTRQLPILEQMLRDHGNELVRWAVVPPPAPPTEPGRVTEADLGQLREMRHDIQRLREESDREWNELGLAAPPEPDGATQELDSLKMLLRQTFGYDKLWYYCGSWFLERQGAPGYVEVMGLTEALRASRSSSSGTPE